MKNLRLVELCSGIGAQAKGLEHTGLFHVESVATADLDKEVVVSYAAIHCGLTNELIESYENYPSKEEMAAELTAKRLGYDFKNDKPYDWYKLSRKKDKTKGIEKYWLADHLSHNLGDMMQIDALPDCDFLTYSTPCQSLSIAGHQDGLKWTCQDCGHEYDPAAYSVEERKYLFGEANVVTIEEMKQAFNNMPNNNRLITLNFICGAGWELDPNKLYGLDPNVFCVKITPLNITTATKEHGLEDAIQWNWENMNKIKEKVESCGLKVIVDVAAKAELPLCCGNLVQDYKKTKQ